MESLSATILALLDKLTLILAGGERAPSELLKQLEETWKAERPDDLKTLELLLASIAARPAEPRLQDSSRVLQCVNDPRTVPGPGFEVGKHYSREDFERGTTFEPMRLKTDVWQYRVYFGTNRKVTASAETLSISSERTEKISYGMCDVLIPKTHKFGEIGNSWWKRWARLELKDDHIRLAATNTLTSEEFRKSIEVELNNSDQPEPSSLLFIHGYNNTFHDAAIRAAQIGFDLKVSGVTAFFSWPSQGNMRGYAADATAIEASEVALTKFLVDFAHLAGTGRLHIVAHSMGNRGLLRSLQRLTLNAQRLAGVRLGQLFLAAPDIDRELFLSLAKLYVQFGKRGTLYASNGDRAVSMSAWLHSFPRAGYLPPPTVVKTVKNVDTISVPDFDLDLMGHSYFAQAEGVLHDMYELMQVDRPPLKRARIRAMDDYFEMHE